MSQEPGRSFLDLSPDGEDEHGPGKSILDLGPESPVAEDVGSHVYAVLNPSGPGGPDARRDR
ncbi:hypothetical protein [Streptomyces sp. NPDC056160]|uniref:hypothetical protein n=1 Tax=Streptomyces sp. NPDC056160 TaxID=3345731 RepID=UPI0035DC9AAF